jgi:hypothetical protein
LDEVREVLNKNLTQYFSDVSVAVSDCPDLTKEPFNLPVTGFGGGSRELVDLGGVGHMMPTVDRTRLYNLQEIIPSILGSERFPKGWYLNGAGAGPWPRLGSNSELMLSLNIGPDGEIAGNSSKVSLTSPGDEKDVDLRPLEVPECALLANFLVSSPEPGKVLEIRCSRRSDPKADFVGSIRRALDQAFPSQPVGLGGLFLVKNARTFTHIMRDFPDKPLDTDEDVDEWLKYFEMDPPFLVQSVLISSDPGLDLRIEHSHGWSINPAKKEGGHYHHDLEAENVDYLGYYTIAEKLWRVDRPAGGKPNANQK